MTLWKATPDEKRAIRAYAALYEGKKPGAIHIEVGERVSILEEHAHLPFRERISFNLLRFGPDDDGIDRSDLHQPCPWNELDRGIELIEGRAVVDFYIYEKVIDPNYGHGDLLTNVQAHVDTIDGKPRLVKITGTGTPEQTGDALKRLMAPTKRTR